jgi:glutamate-1-semialdehyde 2,1-aminomutase
MKFEGAYHGHHDYGIRNFPSSLLEAAGVPDEAGNSVLTAPYNDLNAAGEIIEANRSRLAAVIVDPVQRGLVPCPEFLSGLRRITREFDIPLIFDEVITGFWLGAGGAQERFGVIPDLTALGKALGAGLPIGAVCGRAGIMELCNPARKGNEPFAYIGGTLNGNPLAAVASLAMLREIKKPETYPQIEARAERLRSGMRDVFSSHSLRAQVVGIGPITWVVFGEQPPVTYQDLVTRSDQQLLREFDAKLIENGIAVEVRRYVSTAHTDEDIETTLKAHDTVARELRSR